MMDQRLNVNSKSKNLLLDFLNKKVINIRRETK